MNHENNRMDTTLSNMSALNQNTNYIANSLIEELGNKKLFDIIEELFYQISVINSSKEVKDLSFFVYSKKIKKNFLSGLDIGEYDEEIDLANYFDKNPELMHKLSLHLKNLIGKIDDLHGNTINIRNLKSISENLKSLLF